MRPIPSTATRACRLLTIAGVVSLTLALAPPARAEKRADLDLQPADFVPAEPIAIRVDSLKPGKAGSNVTVTVLNRQKATIRVVAECTLYDDNREDLGVATGEAITVDADERRSTIVTGAEAAKFAECRVRGAE